MVLESGTKFVVVGAHRDGMAETDAPLVRTILDWLCAARGPERRALELAFGGSLRMGEGRGVIWRFLLGVIEAPPRAVLAKLREATLIEPSDTEDSDVDGAEDDLTKHFDAQLSAVRMPFADWEAKRKHAVIPQKPSASPAAKGAAKTGPRFGDESDTDSDDGFQSPVKASGPNGSDNPLNATETSEWGKYFAKQKILELVDKDLGRLWGGEEFFDDPVLKGQMREVLECLLDLNVIADYCQGMHELLSLVFMVLKLDHEAAASLPASARHRDTVKSLCDATYLRHDALTLIVKILSSRDKGMGVAAWYEADPDSPDEDRPVVTLSERVQRHLLSSADAELAKHLEQLDVSPAAYGLRFFRLLFLREFPFGQTATLWDAIFADHHMNDFEARPKDGFVPRVAVAMLMYIRQDLLNPDYGLVMRRLMRYPPLEAVTVLVQRAIIGAHGFESTQAQLAGVAPSIFKASEASAEDVNARSGSSAVLSGTPASTSGSPRARSNTTMAAQFEPPSLVDAAPTKGSSAPLLGPSRREQQVGTALGKAIECISHKWFPEGNGAPTDDSDVDYIMAIAELKRLRDVLLHGLPLEQ
jgi:hypothetical protein